MQDWLGVEIEVGDTIVYAVKESTVVALHKAVVTGVGERPQSDWNNDMVPYIEALWERSNHYGDWRKVKKVRLFTSENITVLNKARVIRNATPRSYGPMIGEANADTAGEADRTDQRHAEEGQAQ